MKKTLQLFVLMCAFVVWQGCGSKAKENANEGTAKSAEETAETEKAEARAAKRARIEHIRIEKAEQRRLAAEQRAKDAATYNNATGKVVYYKAETDPSYTGGEAAMMKYLSDNLSYPKEAEDKGVEGTVWVDFVVGSDGNMWDVEATDAAWEDVDEALKNEATRVVGSMPAWVAGRQHGKNVNTKFSIPITFRLAS